MEFRLVPNHFSNLDELHLAEFPVTLGRGANAGIRVRDRWVSRQHCELDFIDGQLVIRDLGATHGTYVNGEPVAEERVGPGDEIRIGLTTLTLVS